MTDMEATIIAQAAEIERLKSGIPWREGPPPKALIGKQVLTVVGGRVYFDNDWGDDPQSLFHQDSITHHAAITKPGETE